MWWGVGESEGTRVGLEKPGAWAWDGVHVGARIEYLSNSVHDFECRCEISEVEQ